MSKQPPIENFFKKIQSPAKKAPESSSSDVTRVAGPSTASQPASSDAGPRGGARPSSLRRKRGPPKGLGTSEPRSKRKPGSSLDLKGLGDKRKKGKENEPSTTNQMPKQESQPCTDSEEATFHVKVDMPKIRLQGVYKIVAPRDQPILEALQADPRLKKIKKKLPKLYLHPDDKSNTIKGVPNIASPCSVIEGGRFEAVFEEKGQILSKYNDSELKCSERYKIYLDMRHRQSKSKWLTKKDTNILLIDCLPNDTLLSALLRDGRIIQNRVEYAKLCCKGSAEEINIKLIEKCHNHHDRVFTGTVLNDAQVNKEEWRGAIECYKARTVLGGPVPEVDTEGSEMGSDDLSPNAGELVKEGKEMIQRSQSQVAKHLQLDFEKKRSKKDEDKRKRKLQRFAQPFKRDYFNASGRLTVKLMGKLYDLSHSVGIIVKDGRQVGSCFRIGSYYVMTNNHVKEKAGLSEPTSSSSSRSNIHVYFNYSEIPLAEAQERFEVLGVVCSSQTDDLDYSVLELIVPEAKADRLPPGLGHLIEGTKKGGTVTIIGHPGERPKEADLNCIVVNPDHPCMTTIAVYLKFNPQPTGGAYNYDLRDAPDRLTYKSGFFHGSSGSPGFDEEGNLVVMHTCGYPLYEGSQSLVEQGVRMKAIYDDIKKKQPADFCDDLFSPPLETMGCEGKG